MPAVVVRWAHDPDPELGPPDAWELDYALDRSQWEPVEIGPTARPCSVCFEADAVLPHLEGYVRARGVWSSGAVSDWSAPISVPEPHFVDGVAVLVLAVALSRWLGR